VRRSRRAGRRARFPGRWTRLRRTALNTRAVIDQALGILIATQHCTPDQALAALRGASQNRNIRLNDVARDLVERTIDNSPD